MEARSIHYGILNVLYKDTNRTLKNNKIKRRLFV